MCQNLDNSRRVRPAGLFRKRKDRRGLSPGGLALSPSTRACARDLFPVVAGIRRRHRPGARSPHCRTTPAHHTGPVFMGHCRRADRLPEGGRSFFFPEIATFLAGPCSWCLRSPGTGVAAGRAEKNEPTAEYGTAFEKVTPEGDAGRSGTFSAAPCFALTPP